MTATQPLYEILFGLTDNLCQRYPALSPFAVRRERCGEVFLLIRRANKSNEASTVAGESVPRGNIRYDSKGNMHIRRKASDNMIF